MLDLCTVELVHFATSLVMELIVAVKLLIGESGLRIFEKLVTE